MGRRSLIQALFPSTFPQVVSFCGGGGKTTLMYALARELTAEGVPVVCSTTTKLFFPHLPPHSVPDVQALFLAETHNLFSRALLARTPVLVAECLAERATSGTSAAFGTSDSRKLIGLSPQTIDALALAFSTAIFLIEADGAAQKPLKAPLPHEPVFPASTALAIAVVGLDAISGGYDDYDLCGTYGAMCQRTTMAQPLTHATTHRLEQLCALTGLVPGQPLTAEALSILATHKHGWFQHCPASAQRVVFANKVDSYPVPAFLNFPRTSSPGWLFGSAREGWCL